MIVSLNSPHIKAYNPHTGTVYPGVTEADTNTMTLLMPLLMQPGGVATFKHRNVNFYLKVDDDAPDDVKRQHWRFVDPQFRVYPLGS